MFARNYIISMFVSHNSVSFVVNKCSCCCLVTVEGDLVWLQMTFVSVKGDLVWLQTTRVLGPSGAEYLFILMEGRIRCISLTTGNLVLRAEDPKHPSGKFKK